MSAREPRFDRPRAKVPLPLLSQIQIASPCHAMWDQMKGDDRVRHCASCDKDVFDLSEMTADEAEALVTRDAGGVCVRMHRRADGTVITSDCPVGAKSKRRRRWLAAGAAVAASALAAAGVLAQSSSTVTQGEPCIAPTGPAPVAMMGAVAYIPPPSTVVPVVAPANATLTPPPAAPPPARLMGHVSRPHR